MGRRALSAKIMMVQFPVHSPCSQILEAAHGPISSSRACSSLIHPYRERGCVWPKQMHRPVWGKRDREMAGEIEQGLSPELGSEDLRLGSGWHQCQRGSVQRAAKTWLTPSVHYSSELSLFSQLWAQNQTKRELNKCCLTEKAPVRGYMQQGNQLSVVPMGNKVAVFSSACLWSENLYRKILAQ